MESAEYTNTTNVTHIVHEVASDVDVSLSLQQHSNNFTVTLLTGYVQCCGSILYNKSHNFSGTQ